MRWREIKQNRGLVSRISDAQKDFKVKQAKSSFYDNLPPNLSRELEDKSRTLFYAGFLERGKAQVVDTFMIYMPILYILTYVVVGSAQGFRESSWAPITGVLIYACIVALFLSIKGQTPGNKAYDLWVIRKDGKKVTFLFAFFRFLGFLFSGATIVGVLLPLWRRDRKALHDIMFGTIVLRKG